VTATGTPVFTSNGAGTFGITGITLTGAGIGYTGTATITVTTATRVNSVANSGIGGANTFTVTSGQQLHIGIGPVFVLYKIIATIHLCKSLQNQYPDKRFVPLYWMASEDHDIEEIRHTSLFGKTHTWTTQQKGASGRLSVEGIDALYQTLLDTYQLSDQQTHWIKAFKTIYSQSKTLSEATFKCILHVFEHDGLLCLDADQGQLKNPGH